LRFLAYIDPGTGSFALQAAIGAVMGVTYVARNQVRALIGKIKYKKNSKSVKTDETG
jgi:hypothetical protein